MDEVRGKRIAEELKGKQISAWTVHEFIGCGKSAVIVRATRGCEEAALKIFDPELVERFGRDTQLVRIKRETDLMGKHHPNLIEIKDGGECSGTGHLFVAMAYLPQKNLSQVLQSIPRDRIFPIISQIASAARFLEDSGLAHRDIKPENICISHDYEHATLLDLGVLKPVGLSGITDLNDQRVFVGTLRYSPPELLYREEQDNLDGWRGITFYQLGAVLHDIIMQKLLFHDYSEPYALLADAVRQVVPKILADGVPGWLILLAESCLVKDPNTRLTLVSWDHFMKAPDVDTIGEDLRQTIARRRLIIEGNRKGVPEDKDRNVKYKRAVEFDGIIDSIKGSIRTSCLDNEDYLPIFELIRSEKCGDGKAAIMVCFGPCDKLGLSVALALILFVEESDLPEPILSIRCASIASETCLSEAISCELRAQLMFNGPYEPSVVKARLENLLLSLVVKGQEMRISDLSDKEAGGLSKAVELSLPI